MSKSAYLSSRRESASACLKGSAHAHANGNNNAPSPHPVAGDKPMSAAVNNQHSGEHQAQHEELTNKLAAVLSVKPKRRQRAAPSPNHGFDEDAHVNLNHLEEYGYDSDDAGDTIRSISDALNQTQTPPPLPAQAATETPAEPASTTTNETLVKSARRARFKSGTRQLASWLITITVTVFITGCVTVILLGLPKDMALNAWNLSATQQPAHTNSTKTADNIQN